MNKQLGNENYRVKVIFMLYNFGQSGCEGEYAWTDLRSSLLKKDTYGG